MKRTKSDIENAKSTLTRGKSSRMGRPPKEEPQDRFTVYLPQKLSLSLREKIRDERLTVSGYFERLVEKDLSQGRI